MNQLFVCVVLLCVVVVISYRFIKANKIIISPLNPPSGLSDSFNIYDSIPKPSLYSSSKSLNVLPTAETQLQLCNQQTVLIDAEINNLQSRLTEKKQQNVIGCQSKLKTRFDVYKKLYKSLTGADMSADELAALENKIGLEKTNSNTVFIYNTYAV